MSRSPLSVSRFRTIFFGFWLSVIIDGVFVLHWYEPGWDLSVAVIDSIISCVVLFIFCLPLMTTLRYYTPKQKNYVNVFIWCVFIIAAWLITIRWLLQLVLGNNEGYPEFLHRSLVVRASIGFFLTGCIALAFMIWYNWEEQRENETRKQDAEKFAKEAELFKLRQQMQPHFLFNSLNSINALIGSRPEEARKMVQQLSDFLRGTIKKEETQWVSLKEELQYLQLYLDIERVRFGNRLSTLIESEITTDQMKLPALLLQPLVENAIKFGLYDTTGEIQIRVKASAEGNTLALKVENPFDPETSSSNQGTGFGLKSVQRRLYLLFGRNDLLATEAKENIFTTVVKIPQSVVQKQ
ncbi:MAG: sensor histidine kinase [Sphingobacteriales bacterium UTBCD1]|jgi:two-component sensor histidine kinase|nr:MAG: sensor histidine kinase [Sphingobacteriales bacterium UTBCD1]